MKYLGLDVGTKRSGVAFADSDDDILFSLETIEHATEDELIEAVLALVKERNIDEVVVGLPLLPGGAEGSQAVSVNSFAKRLIDANIACSLLDERYTSHGGMNLDRDAAAACKILALKLERK